MFKRFAVVGNPIDHSLSPFIHQYFAKQTNVSLTYEKIIADNQSFAQIVMDFFAQKGIGLNITLPFKSAAFRLAQKHTPRCQDAGAANTLWMDGGVIHADNTDGAGLIRDLCRYRTVRNMRVLILGAGGAARGIIQPLWEQQPARLVLANRSSGKLPELRQAFPALECVPVSELDGRYDVVINATSASLTDQLIALPSGFLQHKPFCYDLSYKLNTRTSFVRYAQEEGCEAIDGLGMLVEQAAEAFFIWHKILPETQALLALLRN